MGVCCKYFSYLFLVGWGEPNLRSGLVAVTIGTVLIFRRQLSNKMFWANLFANSSSLTHL